MSDTSYDNTVLSIARQAVQNHWTREQIEQYLQDVLGLKGSDYTLAFNRVERAWCMEVLSRGSKHD